MIAWLARGFSPWNGLRELPVLDHAAASTRPGVHVVGDLADAPILKGAIRSGHAAALALDRLLGPSGHDLDVVIVGGGPAGIAAAIALHERGRRYVVIERAQPFHTIDAFPAGKVMYADPPGLPVPVLAFDDAPKEALVADWRARVGDLHVRAGEEVRDVDGPDGALVVRTDRATYRTRKVLLAIGRRGTPRRLSVPGADLPKVKSELDDPVAWAGRRALVVGGGDSAIEAAIALHRAGADVALSYRGAAFARLRPRNRQRLDDARAAGLRVIAPSTVASIAPDHVVLDVGGRSEVLANDVVFALIGTELPRALLDRLGIRRAGEVARELARAPGLLAFAALVWCFYVLKQHREILPFAGPLAAVHDALRISVPWWPTADGGVRVLDAGFFGTLLYTLTVAGFGALAMRRHRDPAQRWRYVSLIAFQAVALFGIPEVLAPLVTSAPARFYTLSVPWPLSIWSLAHEPAAWGWLVAGALVSFVAVPLFVWRHNEKFCSWLCGCGGLAETLGDVWRWRAPRGDLARRSEWAGVIVLACAIPVTLLLLNDAWGLVGVRTYLDQSVTPGAAIGAPAADPAEGDMRVASARVTGDALELHVEKLEADGAWHGNGWIREVRAGERVLYPEKLAEGHYRLPLDGLDGPLRVIASGSALSRATDFARHWYGLVVDFALASIVGVALYPVLGNRVWCRFFCPLRAYMEILAKRIGRQAIVSNDKCISCGECTRHCQMGIDVMGFAEQQAVLDNRNSACIQCGVCVEVCPVDVLSLVDKRASGVPDGEPHPIGPRFG